LHPEKDFQKRTARGEIESGSRTPVHIPAPLRPAADTQEIKFSAPATGKYFCLESLERAGRQALRRRGRTGFARQNGNAHQPQRLDDCLCGQRGTRGEDGTAENAIDGQTANYWHTEWKNASPDYPHRLILNLGQSQTISGFRYVPRQGDRHRPHQGLPHLRRRAHRNNDDDDGSLPVLRAPHPSRNSDIDTDVTFDNRLNETVKLFWISPDGARVAYGSIAAGRKYLQHTFASHVWLVTSTNPSNTIAVFQAGDSPAVAVIDGRLPDAPRRHGPRAVTPTQPAPARPEVSPDARWEVLVHDHNLFLRDLAAASETRLTSEGCATNSYARNEEAARAIEMDYDHPDPELPTPEVFWSPNSKYFVALRHQPGSARRVYLIESSPPDQLQPRLDSYPYLKPGDNVPINKPHLFDVAAKKEIPVSDDLFANPWSIDDVRWDADSTRFTFLFNQRGHQALRVLAVDAATGTVKPVIDESSRTFIDYSGKFFCEYLDDTGEIIWLSERDGWNHLYLYDARTGAVKNQITRGPWVVRSVDFVDHTNRQIWFQAGGIVPGQDPYFIQFCRINFDGTGLTLLTAGNGNHAVQFSPDRKYLLDTWSRVDALPVTELRRTSDGTRVCPLETAVITGQLPMPQPFVAKGRDGVTDIYGAIWFPKNFHPRKKYAVIEDIYAGPQDSFTPKDFHADLPAAAPGRRRLHCRPTGRHGHRQPFQGVP
jgi:dipeptidyl-peptidase-4